MPSTVQCSVTSFFDIRETKPSAANAVIESKKFTGGQSPSGQGGVPDITQGKLQTWKVEDFVETLDTGMTPDSDKVGGLMTEVVANTSQLSGADREAMATYLKSLPAAK